MKYLISIIGPTGIGKTRLAIEVAKAFGTEIISGDSRQFYKEMRIGTAVPEEEELREVRHHLVQNKSIFESYSVGDFEREALKVIEKIFERNDVAVLVGGSGLYMDAVLKGLDDFPEVNEEIREYLNREYREKGVEFLQERLKELDEEHYRKVDVNNPQRMIRALEVCMASGKAYSSFKGKKEVKRDFESIQIGLTAEREVVYERINKRVDVMMEKGLIAEVQGLYKYKNFNALQTVGYRELFEFLEGKVELDSAIENIKMNTRRFAKRQYTWFNKNKEILWFDIGENEEKIIEYIRERI